MTKRKITNSFKKMDSNSAYWIGFLWADGATDAHRMRISLQSRDFCHLKLFAKFLKDTKPSFFKRKDKNAISYEIYNKDLVDSLRFFGIITDRCKNAKSFPNIPVKYMSHFFRGLFDGDGHVGYYRYTDKRNNHHYIHCVLKITTINKNISNIIYKFFRNMNNKCRLQIWKSNSKSPTTVYDIKFLSQQSIKHFIKYIYKYSRKNTRLGRKYELCKKVMESFRNRCSKNYK